MSTIVQRGKRLAELERKRSVMQLTIDELKEYTRLNRLEKNRRAAWTSRQKKKAHVKALEETKKRLEEELQYTKMLYSQFQNFILSRAPKLAQEFANQHQQLPPFYPPGLPYYLPPPPPFMAPPPEKVIQQNQRAMPMDIEPEAELMPPLNFESPFLDEINKSESTMLKLVPPNGLPQESDEEEELIPPPPLKLPSDDIDE